jgi:hypothetical protein
MIGESNEQIGAVSDLVENHPDKRGSMGDDVNESSDSSSPSSLSTSSTSSSDDETDSEQNTTTKHVTSQGYGACMGGSKSNAINLILRLFLYHILHMMSS